MFRQQFNEKFQNVEVKTTHSCANPGNVIKIVCFLLAMHKCSSLAGM